MKIAFVTFGCRLNRAEALELEAAARAAGHTVVPPDESPDEIIVRGCSVTAKAQHDCEKTLAHLATTHPHARIRRTGCLPNAEHLHIPHTETVPMRTSRAYLKVQDGCSGRCAFCIVPSFRGPPVSVPWHDALDRARRFLEAGYREIVVTGCNLALYRDHGHGLADLLDALASLEGPSPHRVRLGSLEPGICDLPLLDVFAARPNLCRFIHLSLQSASPAVLRTMNRPYPIDTVEQFCAAAATRLGPRLSLGADLIAGFPGETASDHAATCEFVTRHPFTRLHVFPYSERPGTAAITFPNALPRSLRIARAHELAELVKPRQRAFAKSFVGRSVEVCIERTCLRGWSDEYLACTFATPHPRRSLVKATVTGIHDDNTLVCQ